MAYKILTIDPYLKPYESDIDLRMENYEKKKKELLGTKESLVDFANGHEFFGFHRDGNEWIYREWAPAAEELYLIGDFNEWDEAGYPMEKKENGVFELRISGEILKEGHKVQTIVVHEGNRLRRIPLYATRVVQDKGTTLWTAEIEDTFAPFPWTDQEFKPEKTPFIYECHIGMAQEKYGVGTYTEFKELTLPRIKALGYNTIQIMAIMEHPYYGSFGYQVANFFAASSNYGHSVELKDLINTAHNMGITVLLDVVHSHAAKNTEEGIAQFDGTDYQFFHAGEKGYHKAWDTKLFNYGKNEVLHFLLSNLKFWMEEFHFDGFRFDGVTSMLYQDHGLGVSFDGYAKYFSMNTDTEAVTYLQLANELIHSVYDHAITVAEDMSGMPGMCIPIKDGGIGFDYRLSMGVPDMYIKLLKECPDEMWDIWKIWSELTGRRPKEKNVGYCESHDQALVGDKTLMFRLCDAEMYTGMDKKSSSQVIDRGIALHKIIRLMTSSLAGEGYLNFMGNEFGHPEWIDFPREGNGWSYHYCRRQWNLVDNHDLRYEYLNEFDKAMIALLKSEDLMEKEAVNLWVDQIQKILIYVKDDILFAFNLHPTDSLTSCFVPVKEAGEYKVLLSTDDPAFGGWGRIDTSYHYTTQEFSDGQTGFLCYIPARSGLVMKLVKKAPKKAAAKKATTKKTTAKKTTTKKTAAKKTTKAKKEKK